ncbi:tRNA U34 5-methylaminomethyl-2-thiouridine-forming methyltransferase MnmC [Pedobacter sp. UYP30]|uniref:tRNA (5-methylaminomethyl-2-thiouridine)(34)-methyltransferase MnmD n=1 Tax=Pedobacter sp. UYP30 TaxID=1756400 RepID=UPI003390B928
MNTIIQTADGSNTIFNDSIGENYHSKHGALQESKHVFIEAGLALAMKKLEDISILEVGFGTGLNFLLSMASAEAAEKKLNFTSLEAYPLPIELIKKTEYDQYFSNEIWNAFLKAYPLALTDKQQLSQNCSLSIFAGKLQDYNTIDKYDLIYYDAFSVQHQPEMWTDELIDKACNFLKPGGIFVTYAITGNLKRALKRNGLTIEKLAGAPGKREMLRGIKV